MKYSGYTVASIDKKNTPLFLTVILLEIAYLFSRTNLLFSDYFHHLTPIGQELSRSVIRAVSIVLVLIACWQFKSFPNFFTKPKFNRTTTILVIAFFILGLVAPSSILAELSVRLTLAATTIVVAVREELVYRYVIQNWLEGWLLPKDRVVGSILWTSMLFTLYHTGAQPLYFFPWIFVASLLLGAMYIHSGKSISLVIACHLIFDLFFV